jgi:hypothetical protein
VVSGSPFPSPTLSIFGTMFEYEYANSKRDQQLKLSLTAEEISEIDRQMEQLNLATRQDFVKFCISMTIAEK